MNTNASKTSFSNDFTFKVCVITSLVFLLVASVYSIVVAEHNKKKWRKIHSGMSATVATLHSKRTVMKEKTVFTITYTTNQPKDLLVSYYLVTSETEAAWENNSFLAWKTKEYGHSVPSAYVLDTFFVTHSNQLVFTQPTDDAYPNTYLSGWVSVSRADGIPLSADEVQIEFIP